MQKTFVMAMIFVLGMLAYGPQINQHTPDFEVSVDSPGGTQTLMFRNLDSNPEVRLSAPE